MIYNLLVIIVILISFQLIGWIKKRKYTLKSLYINFMFFLKDDFKTMLNSDTRGILSYLKLIRSMSFYTSVILFIVMASSGFLPLVFMSTSLTGFALVIHVTAAPLFCVTYAIFIVLSAFQFSFQNADYLFVFNRNSIYDSNELEAAKDNFILKSAFWISAALSIPVIAAIILSLYPIFTTYEMDSLIDVHRYTVLIFTISFVIQVYYSIILRIQDKNNT